ncbi:MAG: FAD-dependent oxidoreductase, partial [Kiritimatiellia bacterium]|nr:FAD-dependent oxidoreductase [Kiritimatiellia bacterium]
MKTLPFSLQQPLPVLDEVDVVVAGAGPAGLGAAVAAARQGARTVLIEAYGFPGGMATAGEVMPFMGNHSKRKPLDHTIYLEWVRAMRRYLPESDRAYDPDLPDNITRSFSKEMAILAAEDLLLEAGVKIYYHHQLFSVCAKDRRLDAVVVFSKSGLSAIRGRLYIDATGDGDLAVRAGCEFEMGNERGDCQPMTLCFKLSGLDPARIPDRSGVSAMYD